MVIANVEGESFTRAQLAMMADFVAERGGGLLVLGGRSFAKGGLAGTPLDLASAAVAAGAGAIIVLDLARVGSGRGVDLVLMGALRHAHPHIDLLAGGGIGTARELGRLADAGLDGALVATALHNGSLKRDDVAAMWRAGQPSDSR